MSLDAASVGWLGAWADATARLLVPFALARLADALLAGRLGAQARVALYAPMALQWLVPSAPLPPRAMIAVPAPSSWAPAPAAARGLSLHLPEVWLAGVVLLGLRATVVSARFQRALRASRPAPALSALADGLLVRIHPHLGPLAVGVVRPVLVIPEALTDEVQARCVLAHESAHVRLGHLVLSAALRVACVALWPLVPLWLASRRVHALMELAADARAVASGIPPSLYGRVLLGVPVVRPVPLGGAPMSLYTQLRARVRALGRPARGSALLALPVVALLTVTSASGSADPPAVRADTFDVEVGHSLLFTMPRAPVSVAADDDRIEVRMLTEKRVLVSGRREGAATLTADFGPNAPPLRYRVDVKPVGGAPSGLRVGVGETLTLDLPGVSAASGDPALLSVSVDEGAVRLVGRKAGETDVVVVLPPGQPPFAERVSVTP